MGALRLPQVRGDYHRLLVGLLLRKLAEGVCTQESLADATGMHQTTISGILKRGAGTLDLDEAAAALHHVGGSLTAFLTDRNHMVTTTAPDLPPHVSKLLKIVRDLTPEELAIVTATARSVRARHDADTRSKRPLAVDPVRRAHKTGGRR